MPVPGAFTGCAATACSNSKYSRAASLAEWRQRFHARWQTISLLGFDDRFRRLWDYYLCYCEAGFEEGYTGDVHLLLTKPACNLAKGFPA